MFKKRGRPTKTWCKTFKENLAEMEITWNEIKESVKDCTRREKAHHLKVYV